MHAGELNDREHCVDHTHKGSSDCVPISSIPNNIIVASRAAGTHAGPKEPYRAKGSARVQKNRNRDVCLCVWESVGKERGVGK